MSPKILRVQTRGETLKADSIVTRLRRVTDKLYECLVTDLVCRNKTNFGTKKYCSWMLNDENSKHNLPCLREDQNTD